MRRESIHACVLAVSLALFVAQTGVRADDTSHPYACVLNFERINHPFVAQLTHQLSGMKGVKLVKSARPTDVLGCLDDGAVSVMIIAHAGTLSKDQTVSPLLYFRELKGDDREDFLRRAQKQVEEEAEQLAEKAAASHLPKKDSARLKDLDATDKRIKELPADFPLYDNPRIVDGQIWRRILEDPENLKRISIVSCMPDKVEALYPELQELRDKGIQVEFAPISHFMEHFIGRDHIVPNFHWIKKDLKAAKQEAYVSDRRSKSVEELPDTGEDATRDAGSAGDLPPQSN